MENRAAYNQAIASTTFATDEKGNKISLTTSIISLELLEADKRYQRIDTSSNAKINKLAKNWNDALCDPVRVVAHPEEFKFYLIDGWHRYNAAKIVKGKECLEAKIIIFHSDDPIERMKFEADLFLRQGDNVEKLSASQRHAGLVITGDSTAQFIEELCKEHKVIIAFTKGTRPERVLGSYTEAFKAAKRSKKSLEFTFNTIKECSFDCEPNGYSCDIIRCFSNLYQAYGDVISPELIKGFIRDMSIETFRARSLARYPERKHDKSMILYLQDCITEKLSVPAAFDNSGKKVVRITEKTA